MIPGMGGRQDMTKAEPPMWVKVIASVVTAMILIMVLVIVIGVLTNAIVAVWT